jgi:molybdate transport system ATP-binding protein
VTISEARSLDTCCDESPLIQLTGVALRAHGQTLFEGTNWQIRKGERWAIVGANGSGKSTLARALCGQVPITSGQINYHFGNGETTPYRRVALVSFHRQRDLLNSRPTFHQARWNTGVTERALPVTRYLSGGAAANQSPFQVVEEEPGGTASVAKQEQVIARLGIQPLLHKDLTELSSGERRKVSIAKALLECPRVLILENPFTGLDASSRQTLALLVDQLSDQQIAVVLVTARLDTLPPSVTDVLMVDQGRVIAQGAREAVLAEIEARDAAGPAWDGQCPVETQPEPGRSTLVQMCDVRVRYRGRAVLAGVDWAVREGEHWALLGPNGAGKTTLLSLILGDHPQGYANDIVLFDRQRGSGETIWEIKAQIGWVAPELHLYYPTGSSGLDIVCSGFTDTIGVREPWTQAQRGAAMRWMRELGVEDCAGRRFGALSESQQRLILIARAVVKMPRLLILDEPCQGLDTTNRARVRRVVELTARQSQTSVIYVTHDPGELPSVITHLLRLEQGQVAYRGPVDHRLIS